MLECTNTIVGMGLDLSHHSRGDHGPKLLLFTRYFEGEKQQKTAPGFHPNISSISTYCFFFFYLLNYRCLISPYYLIVRVVGDNKPSKSPIPRYGCQLCCKNPQPQGVPIPQLLRIFDNFILEFSTPVLSSSAKPFRNSNVFPPSRSPTADGSSCPGET